MDKKLDFDPRWFIVVIFFLAGIFLGGLGLYVWLFQGSPILSIQKIHPAKSSNYKFINPLLAVDVEEKKAFLEDKILESRIRKITDREKNNGSIRQSYVYFRDFETGRWTDWETDFNFSVGTLLKIPIMIAYFKNAESDPDTLNEKLIYHSRPPLFPASATKPLEEGGSYTVENLIEAMIIDNDDGASEVLFDHIDLLSLNDVYSDLGIQFPENKTDEDFINIKQYTLFMRVLYNATYLNRNYSEKALEILSWTSSDDGYAAGLPHEVTVSHIYRSRKFSQDNKKMVETHACGNIYYPGHPYNLCMVAIGENADAINGIFKNISEIVYNDMVDRYKK